MEIKEKYLRAMHNNRCLRTRRQVMHMRIASDHVIEKPCCWICQIELQERVTEKKPSPTA